MTDTNNQSNVYISGADPGGLWVLQKYIREDKRTMISERYSTCMYRHVRSTTLTPFYRERKVGSYTLCHKWIKKASPFAYHEECFIHFITYMAILYTVAIVEATE